MRIRMTTKTYKILNTIRLVIPMLFILTYACVWASFTGSLLDVMRGDAVLEPSMVYSNDQLTAYMMTTLTGVGIIIACVIVRYMFTPDRTKMYRIFVLERKVEELERRLKDERDNGDPDRGSDAGKGTED